MWSRVRGTRLGVGQIRGGPCSHARREAAPDGGQQSGCPATGQPLCRCSISRRSPSIVITRPAATCVGDGTRIFVRGGSGSRLQQGAASAAPTWARAILDVDGRAAPSSRTARRAPERPRAASTWTRVPPWAVRGFGGRRPRCPQLEDGRGQRRSASRISSPSGAVPTLARAAATAVRAKAADQPSVVSAARASRSMPAVPRWPVSVGPGAPVVVAAVAAVSAVRVEALAPGGSVASIGPAVAVVPDGAVPPEVPGAHLAPIVPVVPVVAVTTLGSRRRSVSRSGAIPPIVMTPW